MLQTVCPAAPVTESNGIAFIHLSSVPQYLKQGRCFAQEKARPWPYVPLASDYEFHFNVRNSHCEALSKWLTNIVVIVNFLASVKRILVKDRKVKEDRKYLE